MNHTIEPIIGDDQTIRDAIESAHLPSLLSALVHITGDPSHIRGPVRPTQGTLTDPLAGVTKEQADSVRTNAFKILTHLRDKPTTTMKPSDELVREMITYMTGKELSDDYVEYLLAELDLEETDAFRTYGFEAIPEPVREKFHVVVIGAGMSGLLAAIRLKEAGLSFTVIEKNPNVGGTWFENRYPGCRVDSPNHTYSYSFAPKDWPNHFSPQKILLGYFDQIATNYELRSNIIFDTEVKTARFSNNKWTIELVDKHGSKQLTCNALITAVGQLNRPKMPDIPGRNTFAGPSFHSGQWEESHDLTGKHIGVIGTGASAFQFVPEIAKKASTVTIFQRTPPWVSPRPDYHEKIPKGKHWLLKHVPFYSKWFRFNMFWATGEGLLEMVQRDPSWNAQDSVSPENDRLRKHLTNSAKQALSGRPDLIDKCIPQYPPAGKRMLVDNGHWYKTLRRNNVDLITSPVQKITPSGIVTENASFDCDVIIYGTGFQANKLLFPLEIYGNTNNNLREQWGQDPRAYLGMTVPGFPNLFCLYGPNTNLVVNSSIIFFSECEVRYTMESLLYMLRHGHTTMNCRKDVHDKYNKKIDEDNLLRAWGSTNVNSWYKNENGRVTQNWPGSSLDFWKQSRQPNPDDYYFS